MNNAVYAQLARGFARAAGAVGTTQGAGIDLSWARGVGDTVVFRAILNPVPPAAESKLDLNPGDTAQGTLSALATAFAGGRLPGQGDSFADTEGRTYPVEALPTRVAGQPVIHFAVGHIAALA